MPLGPRQLIDDGADVSFRDNHEFGADSSFGSEGVIAWPSLAVKPAYWALLALAALPLAAA